MKGGYQARKGDIKLEREKSRNLTCAIPRLKELINLKASKKALNLKFQVKKNKLNHEERKHIPSII